MNKILYTLVFITCLFSFTSIAQTVNISGKVIRHNGTPLEGVTVTCTNTTSVISDADGNFIFTDLPEGEDYQINGSFETNEFEGVTILDLLFLRQIILGVEEPNPFQRIAGDVNFSGGISTFDLVLSARASVKLDGSFPDTYWTFLSPGPSPTFPVAGISLTNVTEDVANLELTASKAGDVALEDDHTPPPSDAPSPIYSIEDNTSLQGQIITVNIIVNDFVDIAGMQHGLKWNTSFLEYIEHEEDDLMFYTLNEDNAGQGELLLSGLRDTGLTEGLTLDDGATLYSLKFNALQDITSLVGLIDFTFNFIPTQTIYIDDQLSLFLIEDSFESVPTSTNDISGLESFDLSPNPAQSEVFVNINFEQSESADLILYNAIGQQLNSWHFNDQQFQHFIDLKGLAKGTYMLNLRTDKGLTTKRIVKQ